jgi:MFS family permease
VLRAPWVTLLGISVFWLPLSMMLDGVTTLVLPERVAHYADPSGRAGVLGYLTFVGILSGMLVQPLAGRASDRMRQRYGRKATLGVGVVVVLPALALLASVDGLWPVLLAFLFIQIGANVAQAGQQGFIPDIVPRERRGTASGLKGFMDLSGALVGFVLLGALLVGGDARPAAAALAIALLAGFLFTALLVREPTASATPVIRGGPLDVFRFDFRRHGAFAWVVFSRFLFLLGTYMVGRFFLFFVGERLGLEPDDATEAAGALLAGLALLTALAAPAAGWSADRWGRLPLMLFGAGLSAAGVLLLVVASTLFQIFVFGALLAVGSGAFAAANWALTADLAPREEAARYMGLANFGTAGAAAAAGLAGPLVDWGNAQGTGAGYVALFLGAAVAFGASALALRGLTVAVRRAALIEVPAG